MLYQLFVAPSVYRWLLAYCSRYCLTNPIGTVQWLRQSWWHAFITNSRGHQKVPWCMHKHIRRGISQGPFLGIDISDVEDRRCTITATFASCAWAAFMAKMYCQIITNHRLLSPGNFWNSGRKSVYFQCVTSIWPTVFNRCLDKAGASHVPARWSSLEGRLF